MHSLVSELTFCRGTISFSGDTMERMSLVVIGGAPGSEEGVFPNSRLHEGISKGDTTFCW